MSHIPFYIDWHQVYFFLASLGCIVFGMGWYPCECCDTVQCGDCQSGTVTTQVQIEFTGVANSDCTDCGDFNTTTFVLSRPQPESEPCRYQKDGCTGMPCCDAADPATDINSIRFDWLESATFGSSARIRLSRSGITTELEAQGTHTFATIPDDCGNSVTGVAMSNVAGSLPQVCDWSSATADITPL